MNILSLFDGLSCSQVALQRAGVSYNNYYASEIDPHTIKVTQHHFLSTVQLGDVTQLSGTNLPQIDLLCGGFPCQSFSTAGKGLGFDDPRGQLFWHTVRLLKELQPRYFFFENVVMSKANRSIITEALGVDCVEIDSALLTAQHRRRLYWTNIPFSKTIEDKGVVVADILDTNPDPSCYLTEAGIKRITNSAYAKKLVTKDTEKTGTLLASYHKIGGGHYYVQDDHGIRMFTPTECEKLQSLPQIQKSLGIELCLDQARSFVYAVNKNLKLQKLVLSVENKWLQDAVNFAVLNMKQNHQQIKAIVLQNVGTPTQMQTKKHIETKQTEFLMIADTVEKVTPSQKVRSKEGSVIPNATLSIIEGRTILCGKEVLHQRDLNCIQVMSGNMQLKRFGDEITQNVNLVKLDSEMIQTSLNSIFTTLSPLSMKNSEQILIICYWFAKNVIDGYTQNETQKVNLYLNLIDGYTSILSKTQRYKSIGNGWTVDIIAHIFRGLANDVSRI